MKIAVLDRATLGDDINLDIFKKFGEVKVYDTTDRGQTLERVKDVDIVITNKVVIDREIMENSKIKLIAVAATGMNNIDLESARRVGIEVKNVQGYSTYSVVQHTFSMLFYLLEQLKYYDEFVKSSSWSRGKIFTNLDRKFYEIRGKKWGIIGLGTIGQEVANVALAFGAKVSYYSTTGKNSNNRFERLELEELLKSSDIISIHAPLNETTKNLIGENELKLIKDRAVLLNLGRGGIVDERALAKEIDRRDIFIGLDVTEKEPLDENSPLLRVKNSDNLLITPHIAWASREARERLIEGIAKNIEEFIKKDRV